MVDELGPSAEDINVERIMFDEHSMTTVSIIECEFRHDLDSFVNEHERKGKSIATIYVDICRSRWDKILKEYLG